MACWTKKPGKRARFRLRRAAAAGAAVEPKSQRAHSLPPRPQPSPVGPGVNAAPPQVEEELAACARPGCCGKAGAAAPSALEDKDAELCNNTTSSDNEVLVVTKLTRHRHSTSTSRYPHVWPCLLPLRGRRCSATALEDKDAELWNNNTSSDDEP